MISLVVLVTLVATPGFAQAADVDTVGLVDPSQGQWHLQNDAGLVTSFFFGNPGDSPIIGDWDCNGTDTPGMYRQADGFVYLSNANQSQNADIRFFFGNPGDVPIAGDFNGDGCDTVSIYRPDEGRFFIINKLGQNEGGLGAADTNYLFGNPGDKPFVGDFNGNGVETVGLHRESTGLVYFRQTHTQGTADSQFIFGDPGDRLVAGDWGIVDGIDTPAIFRPSGPTFYYRHTLTQGIADSQFVWPPARVNWLPVSGEFGELTDGKRLPRVDDPLGLVVAARDMRRYAQDDDHFEVWICDVPTGNEAITHAEIIAQLNATVVPYFEALSGGIYRPIFSAAGSVSSSDPNACVVDVANAADNSTEAALIITDDNLGGFATPGFPVFESFGFPPQPATFPDNGRYAVVGAVSLYFYADAVPHEIGHTLDWPHSYSGTSDFEYDNPIDVMSGNLDVNGFSPSVIYATPAFNLYQAGWIDPADVFVWDGAMSERLVVPLDSPGTQMVVIPTGTPGVFYTAGARVSSGRDPIPTSFEGLEVYLVDQDCVPGCPGILREFTQHPPSPFTTGHVLKPGDTVEIEGVSLTVLAREGSGFRVRVG